MFGKGERTFIQERNIKYNWNRSRCNNSYFSQTIKTQRNKMYRNIKRTSKGIFWRGLLQKNDALLYLNSHNDTNMKNGK